FSCQFVACVNEVDQSHLQRLLSGYDPSAKQQLFGAGFSNPAEKEDHDDSGDKADAHSRICKVCFRCCNSEIADSRKAASARERMGMDLGDDHLSQVIYLKKKFFQMIGVCEILFERIALELFEVPKVSAGAKRLAVRAQDNDPGLLIFFRSLK